MAPSSSELETARRLIGAAPRVLVLTGADLGASSGAPGAQADEGLWRNRPVEELATPETFAQDPRLVWEWYGWQREQLGACQPTAVHLALARQALHHDKTLIVTQSVDGLHAVAAYEVAGDGDPRRALPVELHGSLFRDRCTRCDQVWDDRATVDATDESSLPTCAACGAVARPHVVWFGEDLDREKLMLAFREAELAAICLLIGTGAEIQPAGSIAAVTAQAGGEIIEISDDETALTPLCSVSLRAPAVDVVPAILGAAPRT